VSKNEMPAFQMSIENGRLVPATPYDQERLLTWRNGTRVSVKFTEEKNRVMIKKWFAILGRAVKECKTPWKNKEQASEAIKLALGLVNLTKTVGGAWLQYPKSLTELDDPDLTEAVERMIDIIYNITGVDASVWHKHVESIRDDESSEEPAAPSDDGGGGEDAPHHGPAAPNSGVFHRTRHKREARDFLENVVIPYADDDCLVWPYAKDGTGRACIKIEERTVAVHRYVCAKVYGEPPTPEHEAAHSCGMGHLACVNPRHIRWATKEENEADKQTHGTAIHGEKNHQAKLTEAQVAEIRDSQGRVTAREAADRYGVSISTVYDIRQGKTWTLGQVDLMAAMAGSDLIALKREAIAKFLAAATDKTVPDPKDRQETVIFAKDSWKQSLPDDWAFVQACFETARKVVKSELKVDAARRYLEGLI
jgi:hypothetical protein